MFGLTSVFLYYNINIQQNITGIQSNSISKMYILGLPNAKSIFKEYSRPECSI